MPLCYQGNSRSLRNLRQARTCCEKARVPELLTTHDVEVIEIHRLVVEAARRAIQTPVEARASTGTGVTNEPAARFHHTDRGVPNWTPHQIGSTVGHDSGQSLYQMSDMPGSNGGLHRGYQGRGANR